MRIFPRPNVFSSAHIGALALCALFSFVCATQAHALARGEQATFANVDFRAVGYGPPWLFEVDGRGNVRFMVEGAGPIVHSSATDLGLSTRSSGVIYGALTETQQLLAEILEIPCLDALSGEHLTHTVTIRLNGREYRGCGRSYNETATRQLD